VKEIQQTAHLGTASTSQVLPSTGIPRSTVWKILHDYLHWHPYRLRVLQELKESDLGKRANFVSWMLEKIEHHLALLI
jgi:hypothetical protein